MRAEGITKSFGSQAEQNPQQILPCQKAFIFRLFSSLHFYATLRNLSCPVTKMLRSILNPFSHFFFLVEFRVEGKTLLKQFNQFLKNLEKMLHSAQIAYVMKHVQAHSTECVCWKLRDVRLPLSYSPGRKSSNTVPFFSRAIFTPSQTPPSCARCAFHHR